MKAARNGRHSTDEVEVGRKPIEAPAGSDSFADENAATHEADVVFRVSLPEVEEPAESLDEFYRETLSDLLQVVRFYFRGKPVLVDGFAFLNRPDREIRIQREDDHGAE